MFKKILLLTLITVPSYLLAQQMLTISGDGAAKSNVKLKDGQAVIGQVLYDFSYVADTTQPDKPQKEVMALDFGNDYGRFYSQTRSISDSISNVEMARQLKEQEGSANLNLTMPAREGSADVYFTDKKTETVSEQKNFVGKTYFISGNKHTIDWDIQDSTKQIGNYTCQKAVGTSRGRQYIVWFTTDLPYSFGPRRLNGLPGLILEAYDVTDRIVYHFKQYNTVSGKEIGIPDNAIAATEKEYDDMQTAFKANPSAFYNSTRPASPPSGAGGGDISKVKSVNISYAGSASRNSKPSSKKVVNFPIDLTKD
ncbi:MAG: GLPGLI family protein [Chitinophagaceae bacterium]